MIFRISVKDLKRHYEYDLTRDVGSGGDGGDVWLMTPAACRRHMHVSADVGCMSLQIRSVFNFFHVYIDFVAKHFCMKTIDVIRKHHYIGINMIYISRK